VRGEPIVPVVDASPIAPCAAAGTGTTLSRRGAPTATETKREPLQGDSDVPRYGCFHGKAFPLRLARAPRVRSRPPSEGLAAAAHRAATELAWA